MGMVEPKHLIWTRHAVARAGEREVPLRVAELAYAEGSRSLTEPDRYELTAARVRALRGSDYDDCLLAKAERTADIVVVVVGEIVVSVWRREEPVSPARRESGRSPRGASCAASWLTGKEHAA